MYYYKRISRGSEIKINNNAQKLLLYTYFAIGIIARVGCEFGHYLHDEVVKIVRLQFQVFDGEPHLIRRLEEHRNAILELPDR